MDTLFIYLFVLLMEIFGGWCVGGVCLTSSVEMCVVSSEYRRLSTDIQLVNVDSFIFICVLSLVFYKCLSLLLKGVNGVNGDDIAFVKVIWLESVFVQILWVLHQFR